MFKSNLKMVSIIEKIIFIWKCVQNNIEIFLVIFYKETENSEAKISLWVTDHQQKT